VVAVRDFNLDVTPLTTNIYWKYWNRLLGCRIFSVGALWE